MAKKAKKAAKKKRRSAAGVRRKAVKLVSRPREVDPQVLVEGAKNYGFIRTSGPVTIKSTLASELLDDGVKAVKTQEQLDDCYDQYGEPWLMLDATPTPPQLNGSIPMGERTAVVWKDGVDVVAVLVRTV